MKFLTTAACAMLLTAGTMTCSENSIKAKLASIKLGWKSHLILGAAKTATLYAPYHILPGLYEKKFAMFDESPTDTDKFCAWGFWSILVGAVITGKSVYNSLTKAYVLYKKDSQPTIN